MSSCTGGRNRFSNESAAENRGFHRQTVLSRGRIVNPAGWRSKRLPSLTPINAGLPSTSWAVGPELNPGSPSLHWPNLRENATQAGFSVSADCASQSFLTATTDSSEISSHSPLPVPAELMLLRLKRPCESAFSTVVGRQLWIVRVRIVRIQVLHDRVTPIPPAEKIDPATSITAKWKGGRTSGH